MYKNGTGDPIPFSLRKIGRILPENPNTFNAPDKPFPIQPKLGTTTMDQIKSLPEWPGSSDNF